MTEALKLAVVGHTNVGKTSLLRTLLRDRRFGEVSPQPSTTRHVEGAALEVDGQRLLTLHDTPGMEDAIALLDYLERLKGADDLARIERFLAGSEARQRFEQEAKVLRQLLASDAGLYVIDAREPVLAKYRDELAVLAGCGKPLLPVLNFSAAGDSREADWREALARLGLHARVAFDSVAPPADGEQRLYDSLALLVENARPQLQRLQQHLQTQAAARRQTGWQLIAELLIDCAACRRLVPSDSAAQHQAISSLHQQVREREQQCVEALLRLYAFHPDDACNAALPLQDGRWGDDLFNPETLRQLGLQVGGGMAAGAAAGAGIDLLLGGLSLGAASLLGALAGGGLQTARNYGGRLLGKLKGQRELTLDDTLLRLLALRQGQLLRALDARGHAATRPLELHDPDATLWHRGPLPEPLQRTRAHPQWSSLNPGAQLDQPERLQQLGKLCTELTHSG